MKPSWVSYKDAVFCELLVVVVFDIRFEFVNATALLSRDKVGHIFHI